MKATPVLVALMMASIVLAGCTDGQGTDTDPSELSEGKGGIAGLLVDDRFRPIHLTDDPNGEFQAKGFILVKPTGQTVQTTANGEFEVKDLAPGTYTLQVQADGYDAAAQDVTVEVGVLSESTIEARRVINEGGTVLTQEYAIFIDCWYANPVFLHTEVNCFADLSRDSKRGAMRADYSHIDDVSYMVAEFLMNEEGNYRTLIGYGAGEAVEEDYAEITVRDGDYSRMLLSTDADEVTADAENETYRFDGHLDNTRDWIAVLFPLGEVMEVPGVATTQVGAGVGTRAQVVTTLFLGEPQLKDGETLDDYCAICG